MTSSTALAVLTTGTLRWSCPRLFNDLNEMQRMPTFEPRIEDSVALYFDILCSIVYESKKIEQKEPFSKNTEFILNYLGQMKNAGINKEKFLARINLFDHGLCESHTEELLRIGTEQQNNGKMRVFCLSEEDNNDAMWSHYAANYSGCMFEFKHIKEFDTPFLAAEKVQYSEQRPIVGTALDFLLYGQTKALEKKTRIAIFHTKNIHWSSEKEWRVITHVSNNEGFNDFKFYPDEISSITFGSLIDPSVKAEIYSYSKKHYPNAKLYSLVNEKGESRRVECEPTQG